MLGEGGCKGGGGMSCTRQAIGFRRPFSCLPTHPPTTPAPAHPLLPPPSRSPTHPTPTHASRNPSIDPEMKNCPSGEKAAHSAWHFLPNLITGPAEVTNVSTSATRAAAPPANRSNLGGRAGLWGMIRGFS
jgi:hypothetical protein